MKSKVKESLDLSYYNNAVKKVFGLKMKDCAYAFSPDADMYLDSKEVLEGLVSTKVAGGYKYSCYYNMYSKDEFGDQNKVITSEVTKCTIKTSDDLDKSGKIVTKGREYTFLRVMTPFKNEVGYDFIITREEEIKDILKEIDRRRNISSVSKEDLPKLIGFDVKELETKIMDILINTEFREFCKKHNIRSKKAFIFYGNPGCGKTSVINYLRVLSDQNGIKIYTINSAEEFMETMGEIVNDHKTRKLVIFEEFDGYMQEKAHDKGNGDEQVAGSTVTVKLQELLDGANRLDNCVVIFTTNHPTGFDKALVRPGRIDEMIEFSSPTKQNTIDYLNAFGDELPQDIKDSIVTEMYGTDTSVSYAMIKKIIDSLCEYKFYHPEEEYTPELVTKVVSDIQTVQNKSRKAKKSKQSIL